MISSSDLWSLWNWRNGLCFQGRKWKRIQPIVEEVAVHLKRWRCYVGIKFAEIGGADLLFGEESERAVEDKLAGYYTDFGEGAAECLIHKIQEEEIHLVILLFWTNVWRQLLELSKL